MQNPAGGVVTTVYDGNGNVVNQIDQLGHKATYVYDALNRRTVSIDALAGKTTLVYDNAGNTVNVVDSDANKTTFVWDALNRQTQMTDPLGNSATYAYDAASRLTSATDRDGRRIDYSYDATNRKTGEVWKDATLTTVNTLTFTYDAANNLLTAANNSGAYTLTYDAINRVTNVNEPFGATLTNTYDAVGNRTKLQDSLGGLTTFVYDAANNLTAEMFSGISVTVLEEDLTYAATNQPATVKRYEGPSPQQFVGSTTFVYDTTNRLTNLLHRNGVATLLANYTYVYDTASRLTSETDNGTPTTYTYDNTNQLTVANANGTPATYTYDANGNRTMTGYTTGTGNQLTNDGVFTYTYDGEGNLTKKSKGSSLETWKFTYDNRDHLTVAEKWTADTGGSLLMRATYTYDVFGNRDQTIVGATTTRFVLDAWKTHQDAFGNAAQFVGNENWDEIADLNGSNSLVARRLFLNTVDSVFAKIGSDGTASWFLGDHLGSIRDIGNLLMVVLDHRDWDAWGNLVNETSSANTDRYGWTSREVDSETGLQYNRGREYNPTVGRWWTEDPLGIDVNLWRYVQNAPGRFTDPSGLADQPVGLAVVAIAVKDFPVVQKAFDAEAKSAKDLDATWENAEKGDVVIDVMKVVDDKKAPVAYLMRFTFGVKLTSPVKGPYSFYQRQTLKQITEYPKKTETRTANVIEAFPLGDGSVVDPKHGVLFIPCIGAVRPAADSMTEVRKEEQSVVYVGTFKQPDTSSDPAPPPGSSTLITVKPDGTVDKVGFVSFKGDKDERLITPAPGTKSESYSIIASLTADGSWKLISTKLKINKSGKIK